MEIRTFLMKSFAPMVGLSFVKINCGLNWAGKWLALIPNQLICPRLKSWMELHLHSLHEEIPSCLLPNDSRLNRQHSLISGASQRIAMPQPAKAGESVRIVGTDPFIIGSMAEEGNRFLEILRANPNIECYLLDTGSFGQKKSTKGMKISVYNSARLLADAARGVIVWEKDPDWDYEVAVGAGDVDLGIFDPSLYYDEREYKRLTEELKEERRAWLRKFEGLDKDIVEAI